MASLRSAAGQGDAPEGIPGERPLIPIARCRRRRARLSSAASPAAIGRRPDTRRTPWPIEVAPDAGAEALAPWLVAVVALLLTITASGCSILTDGLAGYTWALTAITEQQPRDRPRAWSPANVGRYAIDVRERRHGRDHGGLQPGHRHLHDDARRRHRDRPRRVDDGHVPGRLARASRSSRALSLGQQLQRPRQHADDVPRQRGAPGLPAPARDAEAAGARSA